MRVCAGSKQLYDLAIVKRAHDLTVKPPHVQWRAVGSVTMQRWEDDAGSMGS